MDAQMRQLLRDEAPPSFRAFLATLSTPASGNVHVSSFNHLQAERLELWAKPEEVDAWLTDMSGDGLLQRIQFLQGLTASTMALGMLSEHAPYPSVCVCPCIGCSHPYDAGGCQHAESAPLAFLRAPLRGPQKELAEALHASLLHMSLCVSLLNWKGGEGAASLLESLSEEAPEGTKTGDWVMGCIAGGSGWRCSLLPLLGIVDNCCRTFPKAAHTATALLSLVVSRRPAPSLCLLDPEPTCHALFLLLSDAAVPPRRLEGGGRRAGASARRAARRPGQPGHQPAAPG